MNHAINNGLMKCVMQMHVVDSYEAPFTGGGVLILDNLKWAMYTAFIIQMVSIFDDGLDEVWAAKKPGKNAPTLKNKIIELAKFGCFISPGDAIALAERRNALAHEPESKATREDWHWAYDIVKRELHHMGLVDPPK